MTTPSPNSVPFKQQNCFEERKRIFEKSRKKYPNHIAIICERSSSSRLANLPNNNFQVGESLTVGKFLMNLRLRLQLHSEESIFLFVNNSIPPTAMSLGELYRDFREDDGFMYVTYMEESVYGDISFKETPLEDRRKLYEKSKQRHPELVPLVCERNSSSKLNHLPKKFFQVYEELTVARLSMNFRKNLQLRDDESIFLFVGNRIVQMTATIGELYRDYQGEDGFLYLTYQEESVYGNE